MISLALALAVAGVPLEALNTPGLAQADEGQTLALPAVAGDGPLSIAIDLDGHSHVLQLRRHLLRSPDFKLLVPRADGSLVESPAPRPATWRGTVEGLPGSRVSACLRGGQLRAIIDDDATGRCWEVEPTGAADAHSVVPVSMVDGPGGVSASVDLGHSAAATLASPAVRGTGLTLCEVALDSDFEFFLLNGSNVTTCVDEMEMVLGRVDEIFTRDLELPIQLTAIVVRPNSTDPYTNNSPAGRLLECRDHWEGTLPFVERDTVHFFTGANLSGSVVHIAYVESGCGDLGYGMTERGFGLTNTIKAVSRSIAINFGAMDCNGNPDCNIMCSVFPNSCGGDPDRFGADAIASVAAFIANQPCLEPLPLPLSAPLIDTVGSNVNGDIWISNQGVESSPDGISVPTGTLSYRFDAASSAANADDVLISNFILLGGLNDAQLTFQSQPQGVPFGGSITVEILGSVGDWITIGEVFADGTPQTSFASQSFTLPAAAFHDRAQLRLSANVQGPTEAWFIDDIRVDDLSCFTPTTFCASNPNSTGLAANLSTFGAPSVSGNALTFVAAPLPTLQFGLLVYGDQQANAPLADGVLCVGGSPIYRYGLAQADLFGQALVDFDLTMLPPGSTIASGDTLNFQFWYRDSTAAGANLTSGLAVSFCP